jgi:hypothetical protein
VPAADVARLCCSPSGPLLGLRRSCSAARKVITGRYQDVVAQSVHFVLRDIKKGSVVPVLELPDVSATDEESLDMEVAALGTGCRRSADRCGGWP